MRAIDADALTEDCKRYLGTLNPGRDGKECTRIRWLIGVLENAPTIDPEPCEDAVSRQKLLDEYSRLKENWNNVDNAVDKCISVLKDLPSVQPEPCEDAVSREAVSSWLKQYGQDVLHGKYKFSLMYIWKNLMDLPSVQPEIIHCLECKHHHYDSKDIPYCDRIDYGYGWNENDFCSRGERRTDELGDK